MTVQIKPSVPDPWPIQVHGYSKKQIWKAMIPMKAATINATTLEALEAGMYEAHDLYREAAIREAGVEEALGVVLSHLSALSDYYREQGDDDMANAYLYCVQNHRWPLLKMFVFDGYPCVAMWSRFEDCDISWINHRVIDEPAYFKIQWETYLACTSHRNPLRVSMQALAKALKSA